MLEADFMVLRASEALETQTKDVKQRVTNKDTSFMRSLCMGYIEEDMLLPFPAMSAEERETLQGVVGSLGDLLGSHEKDFRDWDRAAEMPSAYLEELKAFGLFGLIIPEAYGGLGFGSAAYSRTLQEVAKFDGSTAVTVGAHSSIGMRGLLLFGSEEQRTRFLPRLATGEMIAAFCLTEPGSGSDAASIRTTAQRDGDDWVIDGNKLWITNGGIAEFFTVFAKTENADTRGHMTAFIVTRDMPGVSVGPHEDKMGLRASSTTTVHFEKVRVPDSHRLGEVGKGFKVAMKILNSGRTGLGGGAVGTMKHLISLATRQANERSQFGKPIREFGLIKQKIGQMVVDCYASESTVHMVAALADQGYEDYAVEAAISKVFASEALWRCADEALQTAGGNGYMTEYPYERIVRDARINRIFEGTNEILRLFIALSAMDDVGRHLKELSKSLQGVFEDPIKGFGVLREYALRRASLATGIRKSVFTKLDPRLKSHTAIFEEATKDLAIAVDRVLRKHGRNIIGKQFASKRLAEAMIDLFVLACTLSRVNSSLLANGEEKARQEMQILDVLSDQVRRRVRQNFDLVDRNEDESLKSLADHAFDLGKYAWDTI
jgi:acyl-CoA dehydrogenase family member 9